MFWICLCIVICVIIVCITICELKESQQLTKQDVLAQQIYQIGKIDFEPNQYKQRADLISKAMDHYYEDKDKNENN